jgi:hypothetical protein
MVALDFPNSPTVGQAFNSGGTIWTWDGVKWNGTATSPTVWVQKAGDTMTGDLTITKATPGLILNRPSTATNAQVLGENGGVLRWNVILGDTTTESGSNVGSDFGIYRYTDGGVQNGVAALNISRSTGQVTLVQPLNLPSSGTFTINQAARIAEIGVPHCGKLAYSSATALTFKPFGGDRIKINGGIYPIPSAGIAGLANTGVVVDGTAGQNLTANSVYYVYAWNNGGVLTAEFRSQGGGTTHATSTTAGNVGVEVMFYSGVYYDYLTLIGIIRTNASAQFVDTITQRYVRSWFNRSRVTLDGGWIGSFSTSSTTAVSIGSSVFFVCFAGEVVALTASGYMQNNTVGTANYMQLYIDGAAWGPFVLGLPSTASWSLPTSVTATTSPSEGFRQCDPRVNTNGGTMICGAELMGWLG